MKVQSDTSQTHAADRTSPLESKIRSVRILSRIFACKVVLPESLGSASGLMSTCKPYWALCAIAGLHDNGSLQRRNTFHV